MGRAPILEKCTSHPRLQSYKAFLDNPKGYTYLEFDFPVSEIGKKAPIVIILKHYIIDNPTGAIA